MKKILLAVTALFLVLTLASCTDSTDYSYNVKATSNVLATQWLIKDGVFAFGALDAETVTGLVGDETITAANTYSADESHVRVFLPTDIASSLRVNYVSLGDNTDNVTTKVDMSYAFTSEDITTDQKNMYAAACASIVNSTESNNLVLAAFAEATTSDTYENSVMLDSDISKDNLFAVTVFMPVITKYYIKHGDLIEKNNFSYTLVPIFSKLVNSVSQETIDLPSTITSLPTIDFTTENLVIQTLN